MAHALLNALSAEFAARHRPVLGVSRSDWTHHVDRCLTDHGLA